MARYTETLMEYIQNGNKFPAVFAEIDGLSDLFYSTYLDMEIGFETEDLFKTKLEALASVYVPLYAERLERYNDALLKAKDPTKVIENVNASTMNGGERKGSSTDLPIETVDANPTATSKQEAFVDTNSGKSTNTEKGMTVTENYMVIEKLEEKVKSIKMELVDLFSKLFMKIYC